MKKWLSGLLCIGTILLLCHGTGLSQPGYSPASSVHNDSYEDNEGVKPKKYNKHKLPSVGFGIGMLSIFGDIGKGEDYALKTYRIGYHFNIEKRFGISGAFGLSFNALMGKLSEDERSLDADITRNLNFESSIFQIEMNAVIHLDNDFIIKKNAGIAPYFSVGFGYLQFDPKGDLKGENNNPYYYWADGSIRLEPPNGSNDSVTIITRDYRYETKLEQSYIDSISYERNTFTIPISAGVKFQISYNFDVALSATYYLTQSDFIDNLRDNENDKFLYGAVSLHYNIGAKRISDIQDDFEYKGVDFQMVYQEDSDGDGVEDMLDECPETPSGVPVDKEGCPFDDDKDGVPNYLDKEPDTPPDAFVDEYGVQLSDSLIELAYLAYIDSLGERFRKARKGTGRIYRVQLGAFPKGSNPSPDFIDMILSLKDVRSELMDDGTTIYTIGSYKTPEEAEVKRQELKSVGIEDAILVQWKPEYRTDVTVDLDFVSRLMGETPPPFNYNPYKDAKVVFRVQLGAFRKKVSTGIFTGVSDVILIPSEDGLNKYVTGVFKYYKNASKHKAEMREKGFNGAFVVAYKDQKRMSVQKAIELSK